MIQKELDKITEKDLQDLVDNAVLEGKTIEYKGSLPGNSDGDKKEFLADVSSFANAGGGDLVFGMTEDPQTKEPKSVDGLDLPTTLDQEKTRLDNIIREGLEPRLPAVHIRPVQLLNGKPVIIMRVGKSWVSPHRVIFRGHDKFYSRNSSGKYPLDVGELRTAFTMSETITERIRRFREERIARLYANETPMPMEEGPKMVLHVVPLASFTQGQRLDITDIATRPETRPKPMLFRGGSHTYTLEGFIAWSTTARFGQHGAHSYVHLYRTGVMEYAETSSLTDYPSNIRAVPTEELVSDTVDQAAAVLSSLDVPPPFFIFLTFIGVKAYSLDVPHENFIYADTPHPVGTEVLPLPEAVIEDYGVDATKALKLTFDTLWNACGYSGSVSYDKKGEWRWGRKKP
jgi:Schlafen, AlbA_2